MVLNWLIQNELATEIYITLLPAIIYVPLLWIFSRLFKSKKSNFKTAIGISFILFVIHFMVRSIPLFLNLEDFQKPPFNLFAMILEVIALLLLIILIYRFNWWQTTITFLMVYFGRIIFFSLITIVIVVFFTSIPEDITKESSSELQLNINMDTRIQTNFYKIQDNELKIHFIEYLAHGINFIYLSFNISTLI